MSTPAPSFTPFPPTHAVLPWPMNDHASQDRVIRAGMTDEEFDAYLSWKAERKVRAMAELQAEVDRHGGKDREESVRTFPHPGEEALGDSLRFVSSGWKEVPADALRFYRYTGKAPLDVTTEEMTQLQTAARVLGLNGQKPFPGAVPLGWLLKKLAALRIPVSVQQKNADHMARGDYDEERAWAEVVLLHNGYCQAVLELQQHAR